jgi:molybdopterin-biosynthesis enzyme MoeA-like protein
MFFTPGVPSEFKVMVEQQILPRLRDVLPCLNLRCACV